MEGFEDRSAEAGSEQAESSPTSATCTNGSTADAAFLARAEQWRDEALRHPDHQQACIGAVNALLAESIHARHMEIERCIKTCKTSLLESPSSQSAITAYTGLLRQWHGLMSFEARREKTRLDAEKREAENQSDPALRRAR